MTAVEHSTTKARELNAEELAALELNIAGDCVDLLRDTYGASVRWLGQYGIVYRVRIGRSVVRFSDLNAVEKWASECEAYLVSQQAEARNTPLYEEWAYAFGAKGNRQPRAVLV